MSMANDWNRDTEAVETPSRGIQSSKRHDPEQPDVTGPLLSRETI